MLVLWLAAGVLGRAVNAPAGEEIANSGWITETRSRSRSGWKEERKEIREVIADAMADDTPEAAAVVEVVKPFVTKRPDASFYVDWGALKAELAAVRAAIAAYEAGAERREAEEAEEYEFLMMVA